MTLQRLVLDFRSGELVVHCLYRSKGDSNPGTKWRLTYAHARVEGGPSASQSSSSKSATIDVGTPTIVRGARALKISEIAIPMRIWTKGAACIDACTLPWKDRQRW